MMTDEELLDQIEADLLQDKPIAQTLRKLILLGGRLDSASLRQWAQEELQGYAPDAELPERRVVGAPIYVDAIVGYNRITGQQVSAAMLPDEVSDTLKDRIELRKSIGEIESWIATARRQGEQIVTLTIPSWEYIGNLLDQAQEFQQTTMVYRRVHLSELEGVVDFTRTRATEMLSQLRAVSQRGRGLPRGAQADRVVQGIEIRGDANSIVIQSSSDGGRIGAASASESDGSWWTAWGRAAAITTVVTCALALVVWISSL